MRKRGERGSAVVEFALGWAALWLIFAGLYQFGYTFYVYNLMLTSVANAAELGSKLQYDTANTSAYSTAVQNMVLYGDTTAGTHTIVPNLTSANVNVSVNLSNSIPTDLTITISNYTVNALFTTFSFNGKPRATTVYMGQVVCSTC